jgi:cyclophilin family peptidyl-prolyl cis-trans isomerase
MSRRTFALFVCAYLTLLGSAQAGILAQFRTVFGDMDVELYEKDKPITVSNFVAYVKSGLYQNSFFHRLDPAFVVQGGGFYVAPGGVDYVPILGYIKNEYGSGNIYSNRYGTIAMAQLGGDTNSANSQWFFNLRDNFGLDNHAIGNYFTVFGRVVRGTNVLNTFRNFGYWQGTTNGSEHNIVRDYSAKFGPSFSEWPFLSSSFNYPDIIYVDISLLNVQVQNIAGAREISWNSVTGKTNRVEFTSAFTNGLPAGWTTLVTTNGDGNSMTVRDSAASVGRRFYRVRVDY